ncbi:MAG: hypothetical protein RLZZ198_661 [Bacteroidota bacterium]|jgi:hypothetical protein
MKKTLLPILLLFVLSSYSYSQKYTNPQGREVLFMGEANEMAMYELYIDPTGFGCECEQITVFFHNIGNNKYITDDGNVEMIVTDKSLNIKVNDESECCYVKKGIYTIE